jgi:nitroreductase
MRRAPTAGNQTLYSVLQVDDQSAKDALARTCDDQPFIASAPWVLVFLADLQRLLEGFLAAGVTPQAPREADLLLASADALIAAQTATIAADALGLGSCYIGDILEHHESVRDLLHLPPYATPVAMVTLGYPTEQQRQRRQPERMPLHRFVFSEHYHHLDEEELSRLYDYAAVPADRLLPGTHNTLQHLHKRKYASDFMAEMRRSVATMLESWHGAS